MIKRNIIQSYFKFKKRKTGQLLGFTLISLQIEVIQGNNH